MAAGPTVGWVRITSKDPPLRLVCRLGEERPNVESGYGGWSSVDRPRRRPLTTWRAPPAITMTLPLLIDRWRDPFPGNSIEAQIDVIRKWGWPTGSNGEPPRLKVTATGAAVPHQGLPWVLTDVAWGDALMNPNGNRVRQAVTLTLQHYVEDVYLARRSAANRRRAKKQAGRKPGAATKRKPVKAKKATKKGRAVTAEFGNGEDLLSIAARELGDADRWLEIAELNGLRDPRSLREGQVIRLP